MGYRRSKSEIKILQPNQISVKEQQVNDNYLTKLVKLRCALMDCENSYQVRILSKQLKLNKLFFSSSYHKTLSTKPLFCNWIF